MSWNVGSVELYNVDFLVSECTAVIPSISNYHYILSAIHVRDQVAGVITPGPTHVWTTRPAFAGHVEEVRLIVEMGRAPI